MYFLSEYLVIQLVETVILSTTLIYRLLAVKHLLKCNTNMGIYWFNS
jgi:hypothetical protein